jgi:hypothetical protein
MTLFTTFITSGLFLFANKFITLAFMNETSIDCSIPSYLTLSAFALLRPDYDAITYNSVSLEATLELVRRRTARHLPASLTDVTFFYNYAGSRQPNSELIVSAEQLGCAPEAAARYVTRASLRDLRRPIQRISIGTRPEEPLQPMVHFLVSSLLWPSTPARVWGHRTLETLRVVRGVPDDIKTHLCQEAVALYSDAIMLHSRRPGASPTTDSA